MSERRRKFRAAHPFTIPSCSTLGSMLSVLPIRGLPIRGLPILNSRPIRCPILGALPILDPTLS